MAICCFGSSSASSGSFFADAGKSSLGCLLQPDLPCTMAATDTCASDFAAQRGSKSSSFVLRPSMRRGLGSCAFAATADLEGTQ